MLDPASLVSVIICNYNYAQFVAAAIESALALDWPRVEVIVVDDGSTDGSRSVTEGYTPRVSLLTQSNSGQATAAKAGFARSQGDVVILLDADDLLDPQLIRVMAPHWNARVSKVQFQMKTIDVTGKELGSVFPQYYHVPSPTQTRQWALKANAYPTPPGSGNAYARWFLDRVMCDVDTVDRFADSALLAAAPLLGDVVTIAQPLVSYRVHGRNDGAMLALDATRFAREWLRARRRFHYGASVARSVGLAARDDAFARDLASLAYRAASWRLAPTDHPVRGDSGGSILADAARAVNVPQGHSLASRSAMLAWLAFVCLAPQSAAARMLQWRFVPSTRPKRLRQFMAALSIARMH
ncbi:MAG TPA: glycosyltransferase [Burkholderiales bacterium]|nr:glycosyltransferase [Burkholderiales bacterium]